MARPCGYVMGVSFFSFNFSIVSLSSLKSSLVPTRIMGVLGQWCLTSGYHYQQQIGRVSSIRDCNAIRLKENLIFIQKEFQMSKHNPELTPLFNEIFDCYLTSTAHRYCIQQAWRMGFLLFHDFPIFSVTVADPRDGCNPSPNISNILLPLLEHFQTMQDSQGRNISGTHPTHEKSG